ncbi:histidine kinase [Hylemonella gracilis str. Niagara R]|uniref:histidine kinase n=1 Tax=Hylemonella gracilis str. Niagara R TaxID=1458275 RepID=A0A016XCZ2_9BURK|nr:ATP-binding protein [Hylemonella gracilis]EYC49785.1 histidine kinase [Hylemonella gracilis str. Niagara R]
MNIPPFHRLYLRLWLAVVGAIGVLTLIFAWITHIERIQAERARENDRALRPGREIVVRNAEGEVLGRALTLRPSRMPPRPLHGTFGPGLNFEVPMRDGQIMHIWLPAPPRGDLRIPPPPAWWEPPYSLAGLLVLLVLIAAAVALGAWPVVRQLTQRIERLQQGVERWGEGDLARRLPEDGQDEVAFLAQRFNVAASRVQALLVAHKTLLANASHELRSPLARIRMSLELLQKPAGRGTAAQPNPAAYEEITRNIRELDQLIDEILLASRLDGSPDALGPLEPIDLLGLAAEECARVDAELEPPTDARSLRLLDDARGQPRLLRRAVRNLLENARRHGAGLVSLTLKVTEAAPASAHAPTATGPAMVELRVCDQGPGVPPALRERIFEPFFRLPGASEREGGVGLGLALVRTIAQRHGGSVHCEDAPRASSQDAEGQAPASAPGACFVLRLPLQAEPVPTTSPSSH